ncbi:MAG: PilT/PilU family type 4a pilus ATPase [Sedimentisphaerales bacterium]|nr:PilT/PilU family type 4a pilus ATPase [Sedimentisphaerales bacterium]
MKGQPIDSHVHLEKTPDIEKWFRAAIKADASDLHLKVGMAPKMRVHSRLKNTTGEVMTQERVEELLFEIMTPKQRQYFLETGALDFAYQVEQTDRFRICAFRQRGMTSMAARHISSHIPPFETLHLPPVVEKIAEHHDGLVLVTGPTGCGKTTTIASMIDHINTTRACHIVTVEDPIEFLHVEKRAIVSQREIGIDVPTYDEALRSLMRMDPDVVLIGEMRDNETLTAAMRAAETGHLVFGTLHANNASQTIQRILDLFPQEERDLARQTFALTIRAVVSQQLLPGIRNDAPRIPAVEILLRTPIVRKLITESRENDIPTAIRSGEGEGMQDFTESLRRLVVEEWIDLRVAKQYAPNMEELEMALKGIRSSTSGIM